MHNIDWKWFIAGILFAMFVVPFVQAKLGGGGAKMTRNRTV